MLRNEFQASEVVVSHLEETLVILFEGPTYITRRCIIIFAAKLVIERNSLKNRVCRGTTVLNFYGVTSNYGNIILLIVPIDFKYRKNAFINQTGQSKIKFVMQIIKH